MTGLSGWSAAVCLLIFAAFLITGCNEKKTAQENAGASAYHSTPAVALPAPFGLHTDDLDGMLKRRNIRAVVMINPIDFFYDHGQPMGAIYEGLREFESFVNQKMKTGALRVRVTFIPLRPDQVEAALMQGVGDLVANALVVTPERQQKVAFTVPLQSDVKQVIVAGPNYGTLSSLEDLGGKQVYVNPLSVNYQSLQQLNAQLQRAGKPLIAVKAADTNLLDDDLVQMVNAGLIPATTRAARASARKHHLRADFRGWCLHSTG